MTGKIVYDLIIKKGGILNDKKIMLSFIVLILIILGGICLKKKYKVVNNISNNLNSAKLDLTNNNDERNVKKVKMSIKEGTLTQSSASIIILDNNDTPYAYDEWFRIDRKVNNKWEEVNRINNNYIVRDIAYDIRKNKKLETTVKWGDLYGELKKGKYRLVKKVYDNDGNDIYISTEFIIEK